MIKTGNEERRMTCVTEYEARSRVNVYTFFLIQHAFMEGISPTRDTVRLYHPPTGVETADTYRTITKIDGTSIAEKKQTIFYKRIGPVKLCKSLEEVTTIPVDFVLAQTRNRIRWVRAFSQYTMYLTIVNGSTYEIELEFFNLELSEDEAVRSLKTLVAGKLWTRDLVTRVNILFSTAARSHVHARAPSDYLVFKFNNPQTIADPLPNAGEELDKYMAFTKYDGIRYFLFTEPHRVWLISNTEIRRWVNDGYIAPPNSIFDVELVNDKLFFLDVIVYNRKYIADEPTIERVKFLPEVPAEELKNVPTDGIVYKQTNGSYFVDTFKYKEQVTVDLLVANNRLYSRDATTLIDMGTSSNSEIDGTKTSRTGIAEFLVPEFKFVRYRDDKLEPNFIRIVESNIRAVTSR